ncbi:DUF1189 domain-containing protein [Mesobacillus maritimus]|nr:DUF1189 domain-containing protein [Mesobacillus maritimus]
MNLFKQFFKSLYSPKDIANFRVQGIGKTILYVFLLSLLSVIPTLYYTNSTLTQAVNGIEEIVKQELPDFQIKNGNLVSSENNPVTITKESITIIFDSTGSIQKENLSKTGATLALLQQEMVLSSGGEVNSVSYSMMGSDTITKGELESFIEESDSLMAIFIPILSIAMYLFATGIKLIEISVLALIGLLLKNIAKKTLSYRELWRMTTYSITLPTVFFTIMSLVQTTVPFGSLINWFVSLTVLLLAIQEIDQPEKN